MKTFINISGEVDDEMLDKFINIQKDSAWKEIVILFSSIGWFSHIWQHIVEVINNIENCTIRAWDEISSAGFSIFFDAKCKKEVSETCVGMTHVPSFSTNTSPYYTRWLSIQVKNKNIERSVKKDIKILTRLWVSKQKIKWYYQGYDVSFSSKELKKMVQKTLSN